MAVDQKISQYTPAATLTGAELIGAVQGGASVRTTTADLANFGGMSLIEVVTKTSATTSVEFVTGFDDRYGAYLLHFDAVKINAAGTPLLQIRQGTTWNASLYSNAPANGTVVTGGAGFNLIIGSVASGAAMSGHIMIYDTAVPTERKSAAWSMTVLSTAVGTVATGVQMATSPNTLTGLRFTGAGVPSAGTLRLYGLRKV